MPELRPGKPLLPAAEPQAEEDCTGASLVPEMGEPVASRVPAQDPKPRGGGAAEPHEPLLWGFNHYVWDQANVYNFSAQALQSVAYRRGYNYNHVWTDFFDSRGLKRAAGPAYETDWSVLVWEYSTDRVTGALVPEGTPLAYTWVQCRGEAVFHLASAFGKFVCGHGAPPEHIRVIKSLSNVGTKVGLGFLNFDSENISHAWNPLLEPFRTVCRGHVIDAASTLCTPPNLNAYGCPQIDKYEHTYADDFVAGQGTCGAVYVPNILGCPHTPQHAGLPSYPALASRHTFDCDVRSFGFSVELIDAIHDLDAAMGLDPYDFMLWDNVMEDPYRGSAKNDYPAAYDPAAYRAGWKVHLANLRAAKSESYLWGNCPSIASQTVYLATDLRQRFSEFFFLTVPGGPLETRVNLEARIAQAKAAGIKLVLNSQEGTPDAAWSIAGGPGGINGTWAELLAYIKAQKAFANTEIMCGRSPNYLFWQQGFPRLR